MDIIMDKQESHKLATRVAKESSNVVVKFGCTNGRNCLHLRQMGKTPASTTIYSEQEWNLHPWNFAIKPKKKKELDDAVTIKEKD